MSETPLSAELARLLTGVLLVLEGIRRDPEPGAEDWTEAEETLEAFADQREMHVPPELTSEVDELLEDARGALEARDVEAARRALIGVGQAFDGWVRRRR